MGNRGTFSWLVFLEVQVFKGFLVCVRTQWSVRATLPPSILFADCTKLYRDTPSISKAKGGFLYLLSS